MMTANGIHMVQASTGFAAQIHSIIVGQMADELIAKRANVSSNRCVKRALLQIGFGQVSVNALHKRARRLAREWGAGK